MACSQLFLLDRKQQIAVGLALLPIAVIWQTNGVYLATLARISFSLFWAADFVQWIVLPALLLAFLAKRAKVLPKHYGLDSSCLRGQLAVVATIGVFITAGLAYFLSRSVAWQLLGEPSGFFTFPGVFPSGLMGMVVWLYSAVTAGVVESIFFIGLPWLLYHNLRRDPSQIVFALITSAIFATAHWEQGPHIVIAALFFNLTVCAWFFKLGTLWPVVVGHTLIDLMAFS